jgi:hypothetical protein
MLTFSVLIYVVSLALQSPVSLNIHNQCQDINLIYPVCFVHGGKLHVAPDQEINIDAVMKNYLEPNTGQNALEGTLVYRIQRKHAGSDEFVRNEPKQIQLLVVWHTEHKRYSNIRAVLVEHDKELDEDKLKELYRKCWQPLRVWVSPTKNNWLLDDTTVLETTITEMNEGYGWDIFISEKSTDDYVKQIDIRASVQRKDNYVMRPLWIDTKR